VSTPLRERPDAPLGTLIFRAGLLPAETIESALEEGVKTGKRLGEILTERGLISEVDLARLLAGQKGLEFVTLREQIVDPSAATLFTEEQARLFRALPYSFDGELPVVAIADPTDEVLMRNIREALGREDARFVVTARGELAEIAADVYAKAPATAPSPEPAAEPAPELPVVPQPTLAAHSEHVNGTGPGDAEPALQAYAPEPVVEAAPEPEPAPVVPEQPALQAQPVEEAVVEEPAAVESAAEPPAEPESAHEPVPAPALPPEPMPAPEPHPVAEPVVSEPAAAPEPVAAVEPVVAPEPVAAPEPVVVPEAPFRVEPLHAPTPPPSEPVAWTEPIPFPQPEPAPPAPPYPPAAEAPAPPVEAPAEPALVEPEAVEAPEPVAPETPGAPPWRLTIRLTNGERVEAGDYADQESAKLEARAVMAQVADADSGEWPFVNGRFLKPDTIVSVDIAELSGDQDQA
jgi:Type II secretion system (T2SS), protein E, N-terminal domain